ncbi:hypothetical protein [Rhodococcus ruber]|uniref:hypothetical protein n=1 Tax=Rhodococcus ruber TaxID=1830 RepID=UPI00111F9ACD|nr:hypothetical protein [Rhodococcus ruber]QDC13201.1 hypothetical protein E2561_03445 [Rhodococcus ruber]
MQSSLVRQCLQALDDDEIEEILASSSRLRETVRAAAKQRRGAKVNASIFRRWLRIPSQSDSLLRSLPGLYGHEYTKAAENGSPSPKTVGVRALLALESDLTFTEFRRILADLRAGLPQGADTTAPAPSPDATSALRDRSTTNADGIDLAELPDGLQSSDVETTLGNLRDRSVQLANLLTECADGVLLGNAVPDSVFAAIEDWTAELTDAWTQIGLLPPPAASGFEALENVRDKLAAAESAVEAAKAARAEKMATLTRLRENAASLADLADMGETFKAAYEEARTKIAELENELDSATSTPQVMEGLHTSDHPKTDAESVTVADSVEDIEEAEPGAPESEATEPEVEPDRPEGSVPDAESADHEYRTDDTDSEVGLDDAEGPEHPPTAAQPSALAFESTRSSTSSETDDSASLDGDEPASVASIVDSDTRADSPLEGAEAAETGSKTAFDGDLAEHVRAGRFAAAWLIAKVAGQPEVDVDAYRQAAVAFHAPTGGSNASSVLTRIASLPDGAVFGSPQTARVALAATLRASLAAGWSPRSEVEEIARQANLDEEWRELLEEIVAASDRNYQHVQDGGRKLEPSVDDVRDRAVRIRDQITPIKFTRANKVQWFLLREREPLGEALALVASPKTDDERREALARALSALEQPDELIEYADKKVSSPQQRRTSIVAHARVSLYKTIESVADCVADALAAAASVELNNRDGGDDEPRHRLMSAAAKVTVGHIVGGPGNAALVRLRQWILSPDAPTEMGEDEMLRSELLHVTSLPRDERGLPIVEDEIDSLRVLEQLRVPGTANEIFDDYVARGDLLQANEVVNRAPELLDRVTNERKRWITRLRREVAAVRSEVGRTYADDFTQTGLVDAEARLVTPSTYEEDRFDLQIMELAKLRDDLAEYRARKAYELRERVTKEVSIEADRQAVLELIQSEDFAGAHELLALARSGPLPTIEDSDDSAGATVFDAFMRALGVLKNHEGDLSNIRQIAAVIESADPSTSVIADSDRGRLDQWDALMSLRTHRNRRHAAMASILRGIGLDVRGEVSKQKTSGKHFDLYRATATPVDKSLVPGLGSQAPHYMVAATGERPLLRQTLSSAFPTNNGPNILLFDGVLSFEERLLCLKVCREQRITAIVVDHAVAAWIATYHPRSFRAVQQVTLPFTCFPHYTVVAGNVPDEVFVGRAEEQTQLMDPAGSIFVYGGRQLGKSALLRKIERDFNLVDDQHAIYIDLNAHGIGTWSESAKLWQVLYNELARLGSFGLKQNPSVRTSKPVIDAVKKWLADKSTRRLLLLLDEADAFLEKESSGGPEGNAKKRFENVAPLKGLWEDTDRRFKPVFAGLHKVQRLQNVANTPLAHGGQDVLIGPLAAKPARDLVVKPLEALGYRFENPDAVWRLLAITNMQPGLIQVVCSDLVAHLQSRPLRKNEPMVVITDEDIDAITQNPETRDKIAQKLRLTIELEDRYRVIALTAAIMCMDDQFRARYSPSEIREHCELYWHEGFKDLNSTEFSVYLDELAGLGVLSKDRSSKYSMRSPNTVMMLGTRRELEAILEEESFQLEDAYNPRWTRRQVQIDGEDFRSPLSEYDLSELVPVSTKYEARNYVVLGSDALGIRKVAGVLKSLESDRNLDISIVKSESTGSLSMLREFKFSGPGTSRPRILVFDASAATPSEAADIALAVRSLRKRGSGHLILLLGPGGIDAARSFTRGQSVVRTDVIELKKWSGDGIRSWRDNPFTSPELQSNLLAHSGGWPDLVERAVHEVDRGRSHSDEWARLAAFPRSRDEAEQFLAEIGINQDQRSLLAEWASFESTDFEPVIDIADVLGRNLDSLRDTVAFLVTLGAVNERNGDYMVDPVVMRALRKAE